MPEKMKYVFSVDSALPIGVQSMEAGIVNKVHVLEPVKKIDKKSEYELIDIHDTTYYIEFIKDHFTHEIGDKIKVWGIDYINLTMNGFAKEITKEEFETNPPIKKKEQTIGEMLVEDKKYIKQEESNIIMDSGLQKMKIGSITWVLVVIN